MENFLSDLARKKV